jgi:hypothetical protein
MPINDDNQDRDLLFFLDIYRYGKGGMYDNRDIKVNPAMYIRWLIMQSQPNACRNVQFIFNNLNNKDINIIFCNECIH